MDLKTLHDTAPWDWPEDAGQMILETLSDTQADESDRRLAPELAGDYTIISDDLIAGLLSVVENSAEPDEFRGRAVISMGPALEHTDMEGFDDPEEEFISEDLFDKVQKTLQRLYMDAGVPKEVRRRILEASVRAPQDWHPDAIRAGYASDDEDWKLTAAFCMRYVRGFDDAILDALKSQNPEIQYQAVCAAGNWQVDGAWDHISDLVVSRDADKDLILAAIDASVNIRPLESAELLNDLIGSDDDDIVEAAYEAMAMAGIVWDDDMGEDMDEDMDEDDDEFPF